MRRQLLFLLVLALSSLSYLRAQTDSTQVQVLFETSKGDFVIELYNDTPLHRDNFLALVRDKKYEGVIFHRVIKEFMVQTGNIHLSDSTDSSEAVGKIKPEINTAKYIHRRGAVAAARIANENNPERLSSDCQFYIVTGKYQTDFDLNEHSQTNQITYTEEQRKAYKFEGGDPSLDGEYTIFGQLIDGWSTINKIQRVECDEEDKPLKDIRIKKVRILEGKERILPKKS